MAHRCWRTSRRCPRETQGETKQAGHQQDVSTQTHLCSTSQHYIGPPPKEKGRCHHREGPVQKQFIPRSRGRAARPYYKIWWPDVVRALPSRVQPGPEKKSCKLDREHVRILGSCKGTGVRWQQRRVKNKVIKSCKRQTVMKGHAERNASNATNEPEETKDKGGIKADCRIAMSRPELVKGQARAEGQLLGGLVSSL